MGGWRCPFCIRTLSPGPDFAVAASGVDWPGYRPRVAADGLAVMVVGLESSSRDARNTPRSSSDGLASTNSARLRGGVLALVVVVAAGPGTTCLGVELMDVFTGRPRSSIEGLPIIRCGDLKAEIE